MRNHKIAILDVQPIDPAVGGGRLRLLGLYHGLGDNLEAKYVGTFDLPDPASRQLRLSPCLEELDVPLSDLHFTVLERWRDRVGRRDLIDVCFGFMGRLSPGYISCAAAAIQEASVVVFSHPWVYPLVREKLTAQHVVVYDAHNFEALLRAELFDNGGAGTELVRHALAVERALCRRADVVLTCSSNDGVLFRQFYGVQPDRIWDVPNGVFTDQIRPPSAEEKRAARRVLGINGPAAIFIGSAFPPNIQAVQFIATRLAPGLPGITFLVCGAVSEAQELSSYRADVSSNLRFIGPVTEEEKLRCLWAADVGVNPMFTGSGTNVKMFDFMAAGLPVVSTATGARGIEGGQAHGLFICEPWNIAETLSCLVQGDASHVAGAAARELALEKYSWKRISAQLGERLTSLCVAGARARPSAIKDVPKPRLITHIAGMVTTTRAIKPHSRLGFISASFAQVNVAEQSRGLAQALESSGWECSILDSSKPSFPMSSVRAHGVALSPDLFQGHGIGGTGLAAACRRAGIQCLLLQHHPNFFGEETLLSIVEDCELAGVRVLITCHNTKEMRIASLLRCADLGARIVVHEHAEAMRLEAGGLYGVACVPLGVRQVRSNVTALAGQRFGWRESVPVIGVLGFLRHGLLELIEAFSMVREIHSESALVAMIHSDSSEDSESYLSQCLSLLAHKGLDRDAHVKFNVGLHGSGHVVDQLQACGLLVFPHPGSDDNAIQSLHLAMALRKPVITTPAFRDVAAYTYCIDSPEPPALALAICNVLANPDVYGELESFAAQYADERSWSRVARAYEGLISETWSRKVFAASGVSR